MSATLTLSMSLSAAVSPATVRLAIIRAKTAIYYLTVETAAGEPFDIGASTLYFHASNGSFVLDKSSPDNGIVINDGSEGLATMTIDPADTESLGAQGVFEMPCEFTLTGGNAGDGIFDIGTGNLTISPNVGTP